MNILSIPPRELRQGRRIISRLERDLTDEYRDLLEGLDLLAGQPAVIESLSPILLLLAELRGEARHLAARLDPDRVLETYERIAALSRDISPRLMSAPAAALEARRRLMHVLHMLMAAERGLRGLAHNGRLHDDAAAQVIVPTDLIYHCHQGLFPAERMMVVAGRRRGKQIVLGAPFDVTGAASAGHVHADPRKLGQALIAMTESGAHLAAWFHSHPGTGPNSTYPSGTDLKQHSDWLRDYSPRLLSGIFVRDGFVRLWGSGLEEGRIKPALLGAGIDECKGEEGHVYRVNPG